jgi:3-oxoadipate enol-lactonase/4-carboxymuconolactone decarboxylase
MSIELHYAISGPAGAPALVLLNSIGTTRDMWAPQVGALSEQFRVVAVDARGHGRSPVSPRGATTSIADLAGDVLGVLDRLDLTRTHVAGLSLGGMTAMWLAARHPERINRLALLCTSAHLPPAQGWLDRAAAVRSGGVAVVADAITSRWITPELAAHDPELLDGLRAMLTSTDGETYAQCCEALAALDLRPDLGRIAAPTLVVAGAEDRATPPAHAARIVEGIADARLEVLDGAAHIATVERAGAVTALLRAHFGAGATLAAGFATRRAVLGDAHVDRAIATTTELTAPFQDFITRYAWGDVWTRPGLVRRDRSIATLAALVTLGAEHEIAMHVRAAVTNGLSAAEISEVLLHTAVYAGLPRANRALAIAQQTLLELTDTRTD